MVPSRQGATEALDREANVLNSSCDILGWILHARCAPFIFSATRRYGRRSDTIQIRCFMRSEEGRKIESARERSGSRIQTR